MDLQVFSKRRGHNDTYRIRRTGTGWNIAFIAIGGDCDKSGKPYLFANLEQDDINYPHDLGGYMEYLWDKAEEEGMSDDQIQEHLNELSEWLIVVQNSSPEGLWSNYK